MNSDRKQSSSSDVSQTFPQLVSHIAPATDIEIRTSEFGRNSVAVAANDWLSVSPSLLYLRVSQTTADKKSIKTFQSRMKVLTDGQKYYGRAGNLAHELLQSRRISRRGICISRIPNIVGILAGEVANAARDQGRIRVPEDVLSSWATEQAKLIADEFSGHQFKALCAEVILDLNGSVLNLPIARRGDDG